MLTSLWIYSCFFLAILRDQKQAKTPLKMLLTWLQLSNSMTLMLPRQIEATENVLTSSSLLESLKANEELGRAQQSQLRTSSDCHHRPCRRCWKEKSPENLRGEHSLAASGLCSAFLNWTHQGRYTRDVVLSGHDNHWTWLSIDRSDMVRLSNFSSAVSLPMTDQKSSSPRSMSGLSLEHGKSAHDVTQNNSALYPSK